eukprot:10720147-Alexandrium_andersonii.AAC.1
MALLFGIYRDRGKRRLGIQVGMHQTSTLRWGFNRSPLATVLGAFNGSMLSHCCVPVEYAHT